MGEVVEKWKPVVGYEGIYEVSDRGGVRSLPRIDAQGGRRHCRTCQVAHDAAYRARSARKRKEVAA